MNKEPTTIQDYIDNYENDGVTVVISNGQVYETDKKE